MSASKLPERASLEYLKKLAKDRLQELRRSDPNAKLATALLAVAREHGFSSWRALKAEVDRRQEETIALFFVACARGDVESVRSILSNDPGLARAANTARPHAGWTALHEVAGRGYVELVRLLLEHGADLNAREAGDNTYPLHWAVGMGHVETARLLLDAGSDVHGVGDAHAFDVIGWATASRAPGDVSWDLVSLLLERGARHHIFSAIAVGDLDLIRQLVEENPEALDRRMSRFEQGQTPLHYAMSRKRYDILDLLIELGADIEAENMSGQTAMAVAMLHGDREAMSRLHAAGAKQPKVPDASNFKNDMARMASSIVGLSPMLMVPDVAETLEWYTSIGFKEEARYDDDGLVNFGEVSFGKAWIMLNMHGKAGPQSTSLWFYTENVDELYRILKARQLEAAQAALADAGNESQSSVAHKGIEFIEDINDPFYGGREFGIRDLNGFNLYFYMPQKK